MSSITIGSRGSRLALWQSEWVKSQLVARHPELDVRIVIIRTTGDSVHDTPLAVIGGKGVFTKELEEALLGGRIDLAVHSLKDLPTVLPDGLIIAAITEREDARDALVLPLGHSIAEPSVAALPGCAVVGTSSQRRASQIRNIRPDIVIKDLRGNVDTRLRKLDAGEYEAIVLASAGLKRLGFAKRISCAIPVSEMLPAVGQGALGIESRADSLAAELLAELKHEPTSAACRAERAFLSAIGGGCQMPIAAYGVAENGAVKLDGLVASPAGDIVFRDSESGAIENAELIGESLAASLLSLGAAELISKLPASPS